MGEHAPVARRAPRSCRHPELLARLRRLGPQVEQRLAAAQRSEIPLYGALPDGAFAEETLRTITATYELVLALWEEGRLASEAEVARYPMFAVRWGTRQRPLPAVLRAWNVAGVELVQVVLAAGDDVLRPRDVADLLVIVGDLSDRVTERLAEAFGGTGLKDDGARWALAADLVAGRFSSSGALARRARELEIELPTRDPWVLALRPWPAGGGRAGPWLAVHFPARPCTDDPQGDSIALLEHDDRPRLRELLHEAPFAGAGLRPAGPRAVRETAAAARRVLDAAVAAEHPRLPLLDGADVALMLSAERASPLSGQIQDALDPLRPLPQLLDTLRAYVDHGSAVAAAHHLRVHPQTVRQRLREVERRTGRDVHAGWDRTLLAVALLAGPEPG